MKSFLFFLKSPWNPSEAGLNRENYHSVVVGDKLGLKMDNVQNLNNGTFVFFDHFKFLYLFSTWKVKELLWLQFCLLNKIFSLQNCDCNWFILTIEKLQVRYQFTVPLLLIKFYFVNSASSVEQRCLNLANVSIFQ